MHRSASLRALLTASLLAACGAEPDAGTRDTPGADAGPCLDDAAFYRERLFPEVIGPVCLGCHTAEGVARDSGLVLVTEARPDHVEVNLGRLAELARIVKDGEPLLLRKPAGLDGHQGGAVAPPGSDAAKLLGDFVERVGEPVVCDGPGTVRPEAEGLVLLSPVDTLRKAALLLVGRLPTVAEDAAVRAGGEAALRQVLWGLMAEETFTQRVMLWANDRLLTDRYLNGTDALGIMDDERFPGVYWYEQFSDPVRRDARSAITTAIAREPVQLVGWVLRNNRPWTDLLLADHTVLDRFGQVAYGVAPTADLADPSHRVPEAVKVPGYDHAGVLTMPAFLNRYPTTPTNRNRHRAWAFFDRFLATDILQLAERPIDPTATATHNPTLNDPQCTVCHGAMDPVAGAFQNWDDEGRYRPPESGWYPEMAQPGFGEAVMPAEMRPRALRWLAEQAAADPRFDIAAARFVWTSLTGQEVLTAANVGPDPVRRDARARQDAFLERVAAGFDAREHELRWIVEEVVMSPAFRAADAGEADAASLLLAGPARLLTPEELDAKVTATLGLPYRMRRDLDPDLMGRFSLLYGGIDSFGVTTRLREPNGAMAAIGLRLATDMACEAVPRDFGLPSAQRRLMPFVERGWTPETPDGFAVPEVEARIRSNLRWLHHRLLGEDLPTDHAEIDASYALWMELWRSGRAGIATGDIDDDLISECAARNDWFTGETLPSDRVVSKDADYVVRAWIGVVAYLLSDYHFLYE